MNHKIRAVLSVICIAVITACAILILQKLVGSAGKDLTEYQLYTLSDGTKNILQKLQKPLQIKLYYTRTAAMKGPEGIRFFNNYFYYVRDLLEEYQQISGGKLKLEIIDPRPFSDEEDEAVRFGVKRFQITEDEAFFFGLVVATELGKHKTLPFFAQDRQEMVEYDVSKLISSVARRDRKKIGVISSLAIMGADMSPYMMQMMQMQGKKPQQSWGVTAQLKDEYEVEKAKVSKGEISGDYDFLMLVHPKNLPEETLFAIDQYVMKGGKLLVFIDPHCLADRPKKDPRNPYAAMSYKASSNLNVLLQKWGVEMEADEIAVDTDVALVAALQQNRNPGLIPPFMNLDQRCVNKNEVMTGKLSKVRVLFAGALSKTGNGEAKIVSLLHTTKNGGTWKPGSPYELQMPDPRRIMNTMRKSGEEIMLACRISGKLETNFPDGIEIEDESAKDKPADTKTEKNDKNKEKKVEKPQKKRINAIKTADKEAMVVVVSDVDIITDMLAYQQTFFGSSTVGDNAALLLNMVDFLSGSSDLITIRSRGQFTRAFTVVRKIEKKADEATAAEAEVINNKIKNFRRKLTTLGSSVDEKNEKLIKRKAMRERRKIEEDIRKANKALRNLQAGRREKVEDLKSYLYNLNQFLAPAIVLLIAIILAIFRFLRTRHYAARRG